MSTQILGFFFYDFSLNRAKGQVDQWCIYTNTCTWATHKRKGLESPVSTARESWMEHIQNRVLVFVSFFFPLNISLPVFSLLFLVIIKICPLGWILSEISSPDPIQNFLNLRKNPVGSVRLEFTQDPRHLLSQWQVSAFFGSFHYIVPCVSPWARETFFKASMLPEVSTESRIVFRIFKIRWEEETRCTTHLRHSISWCWFIFLKQLVQEGPSRSLAKILLLLPIASSKTWTSVNPPPYKMAYKTHLLIKWQALGCLLHLLFLWNKLWNWNWLLGQIYRLLWFTFHQSWFDKIELTTPHHKTASCKYVPWF